MRTEDLIEGLARQPAARSLTDGRIRLVLLGAVAVSAALFLALAGLRPDAPAAYLRPLVATKTALAALLFLTLLVQLPRLARPEAWSELRPWAFALSPAIGAGLWVATFVLRAPADRFAEVTPPAVAECVGFITLISILPAVAILRLLAGAAVAHPGRAGALAGLTAASGAATGYSLFCTQDNPLFYVFWYGLAMAVVAGVSALIGRRVLAW
jgi:hypothetical protein